MSSTRILMRNDSGTPVLSITTGIRIDTAHYFTSKADMSTHTAETHRKRIRGKLNAHNSHELAQYAKGVRPDLIAISCDHFA